MSQRSGRRSVLMAALGCAAVATLLAQEPPLVVDNDKVPAPKRKTFVKPEYPPEAQAQGIRGIVILELTIDPRGKVVDVTVVRSIPGLDQAAIEAVRKWEYEPPRVGEGAVSVRLTVPITFMLQLPQIKRAEGIPELRHGSTPAFPSGAEIRGTVKVTADLTLDPQGEVAEATITSGSPPWSDALLQAMRTWGFASDAAGGEVSFQVEATFYPAERGERPRVALDLKGLHRVEAPATEPSAAAPTPAPAVEGRGPGPAPTPSPEAQASPPPAASPDSSPAAASGAPAPEPAPAAGREAPPATRTPGGPPPVPVEVLRSPVAPPAPAEPAISAVRDVTLGKGVPDLARGRRPVVPPFARVAGVAGSVEVRFSIDAAGSTAVQAAEGVEELKRAAQETVASWVFRRTTTERLHAVARFDYKEDAASAAVRLDQ